MRVEQKIGWLVGILMRGLQRDMHTIIECRCPVHGTTAEGGPNFTACLLPLIACEILGELLKPAGASKPDGVRMILSTAGEIAGDPRYAKLAGPLFGVFRHGIAHAFQPLYHEGVTGVAAWANDCPEWLGSDDGAPRLAELRQRSHLVVTNHPSGVRAFTAVPQILYLDIRRTIGHFAALLERPGGWDRDLFNRNFDAWMDGQELQRRYLNSVERQALGLPPAGPT